jgi:hypothetical protein
MMQVIRDGKAQDQSLMTAKDMLPTQQPAAIDVSAIKDPFEGIFKPLPAAVTRETMARDLIDPKDFELKTEIVNPPATAAFETLQLWFTAESSQVKQLLERYGIFGSVPGRITIDVLMGFFNARCKINYYSFGRAARREYMQMGSTLQFQEDKEQLKHKLEGIFGER